MKRLLSLLAFFATLQASAQQVNPVPDYVFRNQMSVGRNAVTDTAAYFSIGPRYGATKGFMPPIVGDTATFSSGKRNGLLIFSVQKNKFLYWDSVRVQWSDMAGGSGSYILAGDTSAMLAPYLRKSDTTAMLSPYYRSATASAALALKLNISDTSSMLGNYIRHAGYGLTKSGQSFLVDTLNIATRAWRQKGLDSLAAFGVSGSGTTNYVPKFTAASTIGNSQIFDNGTNVGVGTASPSHKLDVTGAVRASTDLYLGIASSSTGRGYFFNSANTNRGEIYFDNSNNNFRIESTYGGSGTSQPITFWTGFAERLRIFANGRVFIGASPTDAGYQLDVNGTLRSVNGANFATTSGGVTIGSTAAPITALDIYGNTSTAFTGFRAQQLIYSTEAYNTTPNASIGFVNKFTSGGGYGTLGSISVGKENTTDGSASGYMSLYTYGPSSLTEKLRITSGGNVGIGTASPQQILHANATTGAYIQLSRTAQGGTTSPFGGIYFGDGTTFQEAAILSGADGNVVSGNMAFYTRAAAGSLLEGFRVNSTQEMLVGGGADAGDYKLQVSGNIYNTGSAVLAATSGIVGIGTTSPTALASTSGLLHVNGASTNSELHLTNTSTGATATDGGLLLQFGTRTLLYNLENSSLEFGTNNTERGRINSAGEWIIDASGTDAGDYKLQVVGNARIGTGKLDIASNTTFGIGVARSGTSEVAGQIYNSNGILYLGAESSAGGQIFSGSSAYAAVIGSGANYPLQFAANNITRATLTTNGNFMIGFPTDTYFYRLQVNGSIFSNNQIIAQNAAAQLNIDSSTNISPLYISNQSLTGSSAQGLLYGSTTWNTTGNPSLIDLAITNTASGSDANYIKISDGSNIFRVTKAAEVVTAAPTGGSIRKWKLGEAATVSPTSPNRTIRVEIDGTVYYLHAKTTND